MSRVDAAEKEASEVLHSLLSVERIEKQEVIIDHVENPSPTSHSFQSNPSNEGAEGESQIQWHTPVSISTHSLFSTIDTNSHFPQTIDDQQVVVFFYETVLLMTKTLENWLLIFETIFSLPSQYLIFPVMSVYDV